MFSKLYTSQILRHSKRICL